LNTLKYKLKIEGLETPAGTISTRALFELLKQFTATAERGLRLAIEGQSTKTGQLPKWLEKATDFTFTGIKTGSTVLEIDAPTLQESIHDQIVQQDLWIKPPEPDDTAISLISRSVRDMSAENLESDYYDAGVLSSLLEIKPFLSDRAKFIKIQCDGRKADDFIIDSLIIEKVEKLKIRIPEPQAFMLAGHLEMVAYNSKKFQMTLPDGQVIQGKINDEFMSIEDLRHLWGKKVSAKGIVSFRPSGRIRLLEAQMLKPMEQGEEIFANVPVVQTQLEFVKQIQTEATRHDWLKDIWGKWPGDESVEEIMEEIENRKK
jgi:hypothetical protein